MNFQKVQCNWNFFFSKNVKMQTNVEIFAEHVENFYCELTRVTSKLCSNLYWWTLLADGLVYSTGYLSRHVSYAFWISTTRLAYDTGLCDRKRNIRCRRGFRRRCASKRAIDIKDKGGFGPRGASRKTITFNDRRGLRKRDMNWETIAVNGRRGLGWSNSR